ncbi:MAG: acetyl-CoA carboxylase carboxyl transferase subunit beta [Actinobacteria bacterium]|nr:MAG: acetyl-CoA carboxylase carboxyl transferase subunit beta [Actinomycetota bacterium]
MPPHPIQTTWDDHLTGGDPLRWPGYSPPTEESVVTGRTRDYAFVEGRFDVLGGSMGAAHGEKVVRAYRRAVEERLPMVVLSASGGARMQEGMVSLIQMARTAGAAREHSEAGLLSLAVHRGPTTGGVLASYASLVDVSAARPGAVIGFTGPRVVELTTGERLPEGSHTAESAYAHALIDALVTEDEEAAWIDVVLGIEGAAAAASAAVVADVEPAEEPWGEVQRARARHRFTGRQWADLLCAPWVDLRGTDPTVRAGLAAIAGRRVVVIADDRRARPAPEATNRARDGRHQPAGYRLARRAIALAGRLGLPLLTFVDTAGADPGPDAEADGIAREIALTFAAMDGLATASVSICVGEGGSGGALALAYADRLLIQEHAIFSVIAPEGAAAILERDAAKAPELAARLRLTSTDLLDLGIVDEVVREDSASMCRALVAALDAARPGDRRRRFDEVTARWLG